MVQFNNLKKMNVSNDVTREFVLQGLTLKPGAEYVVLIGRNAGQLNKAYMNAVLRHNTATSGMRRNKKVTVREVDENRTADVERYSKYVLTGWRNVYEDNGKAVPFSEENCFKFLSVLPHDYFDDAREFFPNVYNFRDDYMDEEDAVELGKPLAKG